jgi:hypothetical protein
MSLYSQFSTDKDAERDGVWLDYGPGGRIKIARAGGSNVRYQKRLQAFSKQYRRQIDLEILEDEVAERELADIYASTILLAFEDVKDRDGQEIPFSRESARKILLDLPDLFADIRAQATNLALFRELEREEDAGN